MHDNDDDDIGKLDRSVDRRQATGEKVKACDYHGGFIDHALIILKERDVATVRWQNHLTAAECRWPTPGTTGLPDNER